MHLQLLRQHSKQPSAQESQLQSQQQAHTQQRRGIAKALPPLPNTPFVITYGFYGLTKDKKPIRPFVKEVLSTPHSAQHVPSLTFRGADPPIFMGTNLTVCC
jgi:hypothetical protein